MQEFDIAIIGGGILAYATAFSILSKDPKTKVVVISGRTSSNTATLAAGAMLGCYGEITKNLFSSKAGTIKHEMQKEAVQTWPNWLEMIGERISHSDSARHLDLKLGTFVILNSLARKREQENFNTIIKTLNNQQEMYLDVQAFDIPGYHPKASTALIKAIYLPNEGAINPNLLLVALKKCVASFQNARDFSDDVVELSTNSHQVFWLSTQSGLKIKANKFLIAAGAHSQNLIQKIPELRYKIPPIVSGFGLSLRVSNPLPELNATIRTANQATACGLHVLGQEEGILYIGATNNLYITPYNQPTLKQFNSLMQAAIEQINKDLCYSSLVNYSIGNRAVTLDSFPLIGRSSIENLWILSGAFRDGIHLSPLLAEIISAEMLDEKPLTSIDYRIFSPERTLIQTMSQEDAIYETIHEYLSSSYEQGMQLPNPELENMLEEILFFRFHQCYQQLESNLAIPPEILAMFNSPQSISFIKNYLSGNEV